MMDWMNQLANPKTRKIIVARVARRLDRQDVEDVIQDLCLKMLMRNPSAAVVEDLAGYCIVAVRHLAADRFNERRHESTLRTQLSTEQSYWGGTHLHEPSAESVIASEHDLNHAVRCLPPTTREALLLVAQGRTREDAARCLGISPRSLERHLRRAHAEAKASVQHHHPDLGSRAPPPPSKLNGTLYELDTKLHPLSRQIIADVRPKLRIASAALAERLKSCPEGVHDLTPQQFETLIAELLSDMTTGRVEITPFTRDGGRDLLAYVDLRFGRLLCLIEAKKYRRDRPVGIELVRSLYGVVCDERASQGTLVTTSTFSQDARCFESRHQHRLSLRDYQSVAEWIRHFGTQPKVRGRTGRH